MPATIVVGAQWGDEGKGRVADWLASQVDVVARFAGGDNAGHTVFVGDEVFKLHLVPSGILHENVTCVLGNGMVINPVSLVTEIEGLIKMGVPVSPERLLISTRAHIITPGHIALDGVSEKARGDNAIGTTLRGIGPAYADKIARRGIRAGQMNDIEDFAEALHRVMDDTNRVLSADDHKLLDVDALTIAYLDAAEILRPFLCDTSAYLNQCLQNNEQMLCEGAQGTLLDIDHGDYPFVTSSSPTVGGALSGLGIGPRHVERVVGVAKSFSTRVGSGPMPTELNGAIADHLRGTGENFWDEFGTTTGRPRRCGWLDAVTLRYAAQINGFTELVLTKLDILSGIEELRIANSYIINGEQVLLPPGTLSELTRAEPIYESHPGWDEDISTARTWAELPEAARHYVESLEAMIAVPVRTLSVGPERDQMIHR